MQDGSHVGMFSGELAGYKRSEGREIWAKGAVLCLAAVLYRVCRRVDTRDPRSETPRLRAK